MNYLENPISEAVLAYRLNPNNKEEDRRFLIQHLTETILFEYDYRNDTTYCDPFYKDFIGFEIKPEVDRAMTWLNRAVYLPHIRAMRAFMELSAVRETCSRMITVRLLAASGNYEWFRLNLICYADKGKKDFLVISATNVDHEMKAIKELEFLAESDSLTMIPNKETFFRRSKELISANTATSYVIVRMDVEHFSTVNQLYGSKEGDNILKFIAVKLQEYMEADGGGAYCRVESDIFGICVPYVPENVEDLARYIQDALNIYPLKFELRVSFGCYVVSDRDTQVETMFDRAFAAQKTIKGSVVQHAAYYNDALRDKEQANQRITMEMRGALESGQFHVYLQPKCDMRTGEIVGSEELVRWIHPELGMIAPNGFIPLCEETGFISELDQYILRQCCQIIRRWIDTGVKVLPISVNISRTDLYDPRLFDNIIHTVDEFSIPHDAIEFELTESSFVTDSAPLKSLNNNLRANGFKVLMDDFGSGYSSLNSLKELSVDVLKIDLKFMPASREDTRACAILTAVVGMAADLGLNIVVEGVETAEQAEFLDGLGCSTAQGFHFYRPMPVAEYESKLLNTSMKG